MPEPLVLVPGLLCDELLYAHQIKALDGIADCWVADHRQDDSIEAMAERLLADVPFETFNLAGLSMGGYIAFAVVEAASERVRRLALLDTSYKADQPEQTERRRELIRFADSGRFARVMPVLFPAFVAEDRVHDEALMADLAAMAGRTGGEAFIRQQTAIIGRKDRTSFMSGIRQPTLVLCGDQDALTPPALHEDMARSIPGAELVFVEGAGHLAPMEQPEPVNQAFQTWLKREI
ncbi:MAG: alpha/beta fold hydrolase [Magnetovibrionaceae bacterium]